MPPALLRRPRRWPVFAPLALVLLLAAGWSFIWHSASQSAEQTIAAWRAREAKSGRVYDCASQTIGGYPFRIEFRCANASAAIGGIATPLMFQLNDVLVASQIYQPTLLISEFDGPLTISEAGRSPTMIASWTLARSSVRGIPSSPERVSIEMEDARFDRIAGPVQQAVMGAGRIELHGRMAEGTAAANPVINLAVKLGAALAPSFHPLTAKPFDADIAVTLRGLKDFAPRPWPDRMRELQAANGRLDVTHARVRQGDITAIASGALALTPRGGLDGQLKMTVAGLEQVLDSLKLDPEQLESSGLGQINSAIGALDRIAPGLGSLARERAGPAMAAGLRAMGQQTTLEGRKAVALPMRFSDGAAYLGPILVGHVPPLF